MSDQLVMFATPTGPGGVRRPTKSTGCNIVETGRRCPNQPAYWVRLPACAACFTLSINPCGGHKACTQHTAELRADTYLSAINDADVVPTRATSLIAEPINQDRR